MRLIGTFETEKEAYAFYFFLLKQGIQNIYEAHTDPEKERKEYFLWIYDEEDFQTASDWLNHYKQTLKIPNFILLIHLLLLLVLLLIEKPVKRKNQNGNHPL